MTDPNSLLAEVTAERLPKGPVCGVSLLLDTLEPKDAVDLRTLLADRSVESTVIGRVLRRRGHAITDSTIQRHRKADCRCER